MGKYKAGEKVVLDILATDEDGYYKLGNEIYSWWDSPADIDIVSEPLSEYTEKLKKKNEKMQERLDRQVDEITRLLAENAELKEKLHEEHHELVWQDGYSQGISSESEKWNENVKIIRDNAFEAGQVKGQNDAWKLATKIALDEMFGGYKVSELKEIFDSMHLEIIFNQTYTEAAAKVAEWERKKEEICVGDVFSYAGGKCVVTSDFNGIFTLLWDDGSSGNHGEKQVREYKKVGHIDVDAWLAQIGGESDD